MWLHVSSSVSHYLNIDKHCCYVFRPVLASLCDINYDFGYMFRLVLAILLLMDRDLGTMFLVV